MEIALARLLEIEMNPETDPSYPYFYWDMITVLQKAAIEDQEIREQFLEMVQQRITSPDIDPFIKEVWASHIIDIADERVGDIIESFYDSAPPDSQFEMIGNRKMARDTWQRQFEEPLETGARSLIRSYQMIRNYILEDMNQEPEEELPVPGSTVPNQEEIDDAPRLGSSATFYGETQEPFVREESKIGRNDPCPCGSGKKYKKCHGRE